MIQENVLSLRWFRRYAHAVLLAFGLLVAGLGTDIVTLDRVEVQELDDEAFAAAAPVVDLLSPFANTDLDPPLAAVPVASSHPPLIPGHGSVPAVAGLPRFPDRPHPPPKA